MAALPPQAPPLVYPPAVPDGWKAEWSGQYNTWYYLNLATQISQWHNPFEQASQPISPPLAAVTPQPYPEQQQPVVAASPQPYSQQPQSAVDAIPHSYQQQPQFPQQQQYAPPQRFLPVDQNGQLLPQDGSVGLQDGDGPDGERGLGKIVGGGLLGVAGGLLVGSMLHGRDEHKHKHKFNFFGNDSQDNSWTGGTGSGGGMFQGMASHMPFIGGAAAGGAVGGAAVAGAPATGGGGWMANHIPFANMNEPRLHIHCAAYCDQDVTQQVRQLVTPGQTLEVNTDTIISYFGDPWPNNRKQFSIIYSYGDRPWELIATAQDCGMLRLIPHQALDKGRMEFMQDPRARLAALVWGTENGMQVGKGQGPVIKLQQIETSGEFEATNDWMGFDGMWGPAKTAIAYYRQANGALAIATAREGSTCRMPWNPLAKWT